MITQFTIGFSRTINLGNFESCRVESSVTYSVDEVDASENLDEVVQNAQIELRKILEETYRAQFKKKEVA
jgi:hypothetical protein